MTTTTPGGEGVTVEKAGVEVTRTMRSDREEIVGRIELRTDRTDPVLVHVVDEFPAELSIDAVSFVSGAEPEDGMITSDGVGIEQTIMDDSVEIEYEISLVSAVDDIESPPPVIQSVTAQSDSETQGGDDDVSTQPDEQSADSSGVLSRIVGTVTPFSTGSTQHDQNESASSEKHIQGGVESEALSVDGGDDAQEVSADDDGNKGDPGATDRSTSEGATGQEPLRDTTEDSDRDKSDFNWGLEATPRSSESTQGDGSGGESDAVPHVESSHLDRSRVGVDEGAADAETLDEFATEAGLSTERLDRVEREMEYVEDRLQAIRVEVGTLAETHEDDVAALRESTADVDDRVTNTQEATTRVESKLDRLASEHDTMADNVDQLSNRVATESEVESVRSSVGSLRQDFDSVSEEVSELRDELAVLRGDVAAVREFRDELATIFGADASGDASASTGSTDDQNDDPDLSSQDDGG